jgi:hypothetical protein
MFGSVAYVPSSLPSQYRSQIDSLFPTFRYLALHPRLEYGVAVVVAF